MGEVGNFLYGQIIVRSSLEQLFGSPFSTVMKLHDVRVGAVHAGAVLQLIYGIAPSLDAKASVVPVICGEGKRLFLPRRFRLDFLLFFQLRLRRDGNGLFLQLSSGSAANVKPELVLEAYCKSLGKEYPQFAFRINREEVYADAGEHDFVTLESFGEEIGEHVG